MRHRKLTEGCLYALRALAENGGSLDVHNRVVAGNLRVVERVFPEFVTLTVSPGRGPMRAAITERGLDFITPRKIARARAHAVEVRA